MEFGNFDSLETIVSFQHLHATLLQVALHRHELEVAVVGSEAFVLRILECNAFYL